MCLCVCVGCLCVVYRWVDAFHFSFFVRKLFFFVLVVMVVVVAVVFYHNWKWNTNNDTLVIEHLILNNSIVCYVKSHGVICQTNFQKCVSYPYGPIWQGVRRDKTCLVTYFLK